jgi:hypothetical protein
MIATIKTPSISDMKRGLWKAMDLGVECDVFSDNTFNIVVHEQKRADAIALAARGTIIAVVDKMPIRPY